MQLICSLKLSYVCCLRETDGLLTTYAEIECIAKLARLMLYL